MDVIRRFRARSYSYTAVLVLVACASEGITGDATETDPLVRAVIELGFRPDMIVDRGDHFLVEGDIMIAKQSLRALTDTGRRRPDPADTAGPSVYFQWGTTNLVAPAAVNYIRINTSGAESSWQTAILQATSEWNDITPGATIKFVEGSPADITFLMTSSLPFVNCSNGVVAAADFPSASKPGPTIQISSQFTNCLSASQKKNNMSHELGHTIGFRHTNWNNVDCPGGCGWNPGAEGAILIAGTPQSDAQSVMNGGTGLNSWNGFSHYDKVGALMLYPPPVNVVAPTYPSGVPYLAWSAVPGASAYRVVYVESGGWMDEQHEHWPISSLAYSSWTSGTSTSFNNRSYTGISHCQGAVPPTIFSYWFDGRFDLEIEYPIGIVQRKNIGWAEVLTCW